MTQKTQACSNAFTPALMLSACVTTSETSRSAPRIPTQRGTRISSWPGLCCRKARDRKRQGTLSEGAENRSRSSLPANILRWRWWFSARGELRLRQTSISAARRQ